MALASGTRLGPYEILAPIGAGGMGEVYRARDSRLGRDVALKVLPGSAAGDSERLARLEREARALAALSHPNIVVIHSIEREGGVPYITMELVEGRTLDRLVAPGGLPLERLLETSLAIAEAVTAAHGKGVVHRDLKPANVIVTPDDRVKVLDFGLAKLTEPDTLPGDAEAPTAGTPPSVAGRAVGTVPYMAPEQLRGEAVDERADLFALGVIMFELASGRRPFGGATQADVISAILRDDPPPLAAARPDLPQALVGVVGRCLEKAPRDRIRSAREVGEELRSILRTLRRPADTPGTVSADTPSIAVLPFSNMSADPENEYFSDGLSEELLNALAKIPELKVTGRTSSFAFKGKSEDLRVIGQKLGVTTLLEGSVRKAGQRVRITAQLVKAADGFHLWSETYDRVLDDIFAVQDDIARAVSTALHVTLLGRPARAAGSSVESFQLVLRGNHFLRQNTPAAVARSVAHDREAIDRNSGDAAAWAGLANAHALQAGYGYADLQESYASAKEAAEKALALDAGLAVAHEVMGLILCFLELRWKEAIEEIRRARALAPGASGPLSAMSYLLSLRGRFDEALPLARRAQEVDPLDPGAHMNRGRIETLAGNLESAHEALSRALELSPDMTAQHLALGLIHLRRGLRDQAMAEIGKEPSAGYRAYGLTIAYHALGMQRESDAALRTLLAGDEAWGYQFAGAHAVRGETDEAFRWLERAFELRDAGLMTLKVNPQLENLHGDPRWPRLLAKLGLQD